MFSFFKKNKKPSNTIAITDDNFNEIVGNATQPVLIDFWASWCGPCKVIGPIIDELADDFEGRAIIAKVNTEINPKLSAYFKIKSIPTLMIIAHNQVYERFQGLIPKPNLEEIIEEYIVDYEQLRPKTESTEEE